MTTWTFESLGTSDLSTLDRVLTEHKAPSFSSLVGWEWRGWNVLSPVAKPVMAAMGFQRFAKGFYETSGATSPEAMDAAPFIRGYNVKIKTGPINGPWTPHEKDGRPVRHSYYKVYPPQKGERREGRYPDALFLDYSLGEPANGLFDGRGVRDFLVEINKDLLLGKAYFTLGPLTVVGGFFVVERLQRADSAGAKAA